MPQGRVELGPKLRFVRGGCWVRPPWAQCADIGAGDGGIPAHAAGDNDMDPAQQRRSDGGSGLTIGEAGCGWRPVKCR